MLTVLVINPKGGSGKTTVCTNIASYFASKKIKTAIMDYDPQGSSLQWLRLRPDNVEKIHGANAAPLKSSTFQRNPQSWIPSDIDILIIDAPAGAHGLLLQELVQQSNFIVIPVAPSPIDIYATTDFIKDLFLTGGLRTSKAKIAVIANRVRIGPSSMYTSLENFLSSLKLPLLADLHESDHYLEAVAKGLGIFELNEKDTAAERRDFLPIVKWIDGHAPSKRQSNNQNTVINLEGSKKWAEYRADGFTLNATIKSKNQS